MKLLKSKRMLLLAKKVRRKDKKAPLDGLHTASVYETLPNGWHYQAGVTTDTRFFKKPMVEVFAFRPPRTMAAVSATHVYREEF